MKMIIKAMIPFNIPTRIGVEEDAVAQLLNNEPLRLCGGGNYNQKCQNFLKRELGFQNVLMTTSCTHALEMAMILCNVGFGDEVIVPSYTFPSTANAVVLRGATPVFVDIEPETFNINCDLIEKAINERTKAIMVVHYGGVSCDFLKLKAISDRHNIFIVEDAAQAIGAKYKDQYLGGLGDLAAFSFHDTKNITCGEGGALVVNNKKLVDRAEIIHEKGTNRKQFFAGKIEKYSWVDMGSSYLLSELNAAFLYIQLENLHSVNEKRLKIWNTYYSRLKDIKGIKVPFIPTYATHNAHLFYIKLDSIKLRSSLMSFLEEKEIQSYFHYVPLHTSPAGLKYGKFHGEDNYTTQESDKILRLPLYTAQSIEDCHKICDEIIKWSQHAL